MVAKNKRKKKSSLRSILGYFAFTAVGLSIIAFLVVTNWKIYQKREGLAERVEELKAKVDLLEKRSKELKDNESFLGSKDHLEEVARDQLDMKKPGEEVVVIQKEEGQEQEEQEEKKSWWERVKNLWQR